MFRNANMVLLQSEKKSNVDEVGECLYEVCKFHAKSAKEQSAQRFWFTSCALFLSKPGLVTVISDIVKRGGNKTKKSLRGVT